MVGNVSVSTLSLAIFLLFATTYAHGELADGSIFENAFQELTDYWMTNYVKPGFHPRQLLYANSASEPIKDFLTPILFPNITDPMYPEDETSKFQSGLITGNYSNADTVILGLSTLHDTIWADLPPGKPDFIIQFNLSKYFVEGEYESYLNLFNDQIQFTGKGHYTFEMLNAFLIFEVGFNLTETTTELTRLSFDFGSEKFEINYENAFINNVIANWDEINQEIQIIYETYKPTFQNVVVPQLRLVINELVKNCNFNDLIKGDFSCLFKEESDTPL